MVALMGGLFLSLAVFALARDSGRFYQREARIANATVGGLLGFERLRQDIARAGFLVSPNAMRDGRLCGAPNASWPTALRDLASIRVTTPVGSFPSLAANGRTPPAIVLAGSYGSADVFGATSLNNGATIVFNLGNSFPGQPPQPALARLGNSTWPTTDALQAVFAAGRAVRIVQSGQQYYAPIVTAVGGASPTVTVSNSPALPVPGGPLHCGLDIIGSAANKPTINVVNFIHYQLGTPQTATGQSDYAPLYAASNSGDAAPGEAGRTELLRVEQDINGADINGTEEVVAEYAVDFDLQLTVVSSVTGCCDPTLAVVTPGTGDFASYTGSAFTTGSRPELIRSVRVRLGVRSREGDRPSTVANPTGNGLFRFNLGTGTSEAYARVRTFQADVLLHNQADILW